MKRKITLNLALSLFLTLSSALSGGQETTDLEKILGDWELEVDAGGGEYYYLYLHFEDSDSILTGEISESQGFFTDVPLENIQFDGHALSFEFTVPTPPDGLERLVVAEFTVSEDKMDGFLSLPDIGVSAPAVATREIN